MKNPEHIKIAAKEMTADRIDQYFVKTKEFEKFDVLTRLLDVERPELAIVFGRTKRRVDELIRGLKLRGYRAEGMHGDLDQNKRLAVLRDFKAGHIDVLVATDVAARGLDVSGVTHVYNYDITQDQESYVHRIGRTGRAGKSGRSVTFVSYNEMGYLRAIENMTKKPMKGLKPPTKEEAYQASLSVAMDDVLRDLSDDSAKAKLAKFDKQAASLLEKFDAKELVALLLQGRVKDPDNQEEVKITAERPLPYNGEGKGFKKKVKVAADATKVVEMATVMATVAVTVEIVMVKMATAVEIANATGKTVMITVAVTVENVMTVVLTIVNKEKKLLVNVPQELKNQLAS